MNTVKFLSAVYSSIPKYIFRTGFAFKPFSINLLLTYSCNLKCQTCFYYNDNIRDKTLRKISIRNRDQLSYKDYSEILDEANAMGIKHITLHGGEPTIHPLFDKILMKIRELDMKLSFFTNGYDTLSKIDLLALVRNNIKMITISVDGINELQDYIRGKKGLYAKQLQLMDSLKRRRIRFSVFCYISSLNYRNIFDIFRTLQELEYGYDCGFGLVSFLSESDEELSKNLFKNMDIYSGETAIGSLNLNKRLTTIDIQILDEQKRQILNYIKMNNIKTKIYFPTYKTTREHFGEYDLRKKSCNYFNTRIVVDPYGDIIPCVNHGMLGCKIGSIKNRINRVWNNKNFRKYRKLMNRQLIPACKRCCGLQELENISQ